VEKVTVSDKQEKGRWGSREVEILAVRMLKNNVEHALFHTGESISVEIDYVFNEATSDVVFGVGINRVDGLVIHGTNTDLERILIPDLGQSGTVTFCVERLDLLEASYTLDVAVHRQDGYPYDYHQGVVKFLMRSEFKQVGIISPKHSWNFRIVEAKRKAV